MFVPVSEYQAAGKILIGEVQAVVLISVMKAIVEPQTPLIKAAAPMIVDKVAKVPEAGCNVQESAATSRAYIGPGLVHGPPRADVELINDQIPEIRWSPVCIMPDVVRGVTNDAMRCGKGWLECQFTCERIALKSATVLSLDPEHVPQPTRGTLEKPCPCLISQRRESIARARDPTW